MGCVQRHGRNQPVAKRCLSCGRVSVLVETASRRRGSDGSAGVLNCLDLKVLPSSASQLVSDTMFEVSSASGGGKLSFGILAALWAASSGMGAISQSLNAAYHVEESRSWWKQRLVAVGLTVALAFLIV